MNKTKHFLNSKAILILTIISFSFGFSHTGKHANQGKFWQIQEGSKTIQADYLSLKDQDVSLRELKTNAIFTFPLTDFSMEDQLLILRHNELSQKINAHHKKPNDIYVMNKKIAGILLSNVHSRKEVIYQALSLGININSDLNIRSFDSKAKADHTSFVKELGVEVNREKILVDIIQSIDLAIQKQINL